MFTFSQTIKLQETATAKGLELWEAIMVDDRELRLAEIDGISVFDTYDNPIETIALTLDNLLPWLDKILVKDGVAIEEKQNSSGYLKCKVKILTIDFKKYVIKGLNIVNNAELQCDPFVTAFWDGARIKEYEKEIGNTYIFAGFMSGDSFLIVEYGESSKTVANKLKQQATTQYYSDPQTLTDSICEAINNNF